MSKSLFSILLVSLCSYYLSNNFFDPLASKSIAIATLMVLLWITETLELPVVGLLPLFLFPLLGLQNIDKVTSYYSNPILYLFLGGFIIGIAIEKSCLHRRLALLLISNIGTSGNKILLSFIVCTGFISMWISNTATTLMMLPLALSILHALKKTKSGNIKNLEMSLILSVAYAANFGGVATLIGSPPNLAMAAYIEKTYNHKIAFIDWMIIGVPISLSLLLMLFFTLAYLLPNGLKQDQDLLSFIRQERFALNKLTDIELKTSLIFLSVVTFWVFGSFIQEYLPFKIHDSSVAIAGAVAFFVIKSGGKPILDWSDTKEIPWGVLLLFGGGLALAASLEENKVLESVASSTSFLSTQPYWLVIFSIVVFSLFASELLNNISQVIIFLPIVCSMATAMHYDPVIFATALTISAGSASMLPSGTPPNAIVFASGSIPMKQMLKIGFILNIISTLIISLVFLYFIKITS